MRYKERENHGFQWMSLFRKLLFHAYLDCIINFTKPEVFSWLHHSANASANAYASLQPVCQQPLTNWLKNMNFSLVTGGYQGKMDRSLTLLWILAILFTATFSKYSQLAKEYLFFPNSQWLPGVHQLDCVTGASSSLLWLIPERDIYETVRWETLIEILIGFLHFYFHLFDLNKPLPQISALRGW